MISGEAIKDRLAWADERTDDEIMNRYIAGLVANLNELEPDDPHRLSTAIRAAICGLYRTAYKAGAMATMGAEADRGEARK